MSASTTKVEIKERHAPEQQTTKRLHVEPILEPKDIRLIKRLLTYRPRDLALFTWGSTPLFWASDLVPITVDQVRHLKAGDHFTIREVKTVKMREVTINRSVQEALQDLLQAMPDVLFRKGRQALCVPYLNALV